MGSPRRLDPSRAGLSVGGSRSAALRLPGRIDPVPVSGFQSVGRPPRGTEQPNSLVGVGAVFTPAVGDDVNSARQRRQDLAKPFRRRRDGALEVTSQILRLGPDIDDHEVLSPLEPSAKSLVIHGLDLFSVAEIRLCPTIESFVMAASNTLKGSPQRVDILGHQLVVDVATVAAGSDQTVVGETPKMMRRVGHRLIYRGGDLLDRSRGLGEDVEDLEASPTGQRGGHPGERVEQGVLGRSGTDYVGHGEYSSIRLTVEDQTHIFKQSLDCEDG